MSNVNDDGWLTSGPTDPDEVRSFYDAWSDRYDDDLAGWDYRAPARIAGQLAAHGDLSAAVLDAGCGTGLSGRALRAAGFHGDLVGVDLSEASLSIAGDSGVYTSVRAASLNEPLPFADAAFGALACIGVLTYVPDVEACWREFCRLTTSGGVVAFTQREDIWLERGCRNVLDRLASEGRWTPLEVSDPEPYLPAIGDEMGEIGAHYVCCRVG